jgi:hypothetical protein
MPITTTDIVCYNLALPIQFLLVHGGIDKDVVFIWRQLCQGYRERGMRVSPYFVKHTFRAMSRVGMVESTQYMIVLGKMLRHVTFGNVYWEFDCVHI